jgi:ribosome recycling factor
MQEHEVKQKMEKAIEALKKNFSGVRTGRANPGLVENVLVDAYGQKMPLKQMGSINVPENRTISVTPFDPSTLHAIEKAIASSELGLMPRQEGHILYIRLPELTAERRKELEKIVKNMSEESKIVIRNIRRDALDAYKKENSSKDDLKHMEDKVQKITDEFNKKIDEALAFKEKEINQI